MRSKFLKSILFVSLLCFSFAFYKPYEIPGKNEVLLQVMMQALNTGHYQPWEVDDKFSEKVFKVYTDRVDFNKKFLLKEDIDKLDDYKQKLDDEIKAGTFEFFELSSSILENRIKENEGYYKEILSKPFDFTVNENIETDGDKLPYASTKEQLKEEWRKYLKYQTLLKLYEITTAQEKLKEKKDTSYVDKSFAALEEEARSKVLKTNDDWFKRMHQLEKSDRLSVYLNTIANVYDPHTEFFPPKEKANFDIAMSGRLEGIGASLAEKDDQVKVMEIVPGSASWRQGQLKAGDIILKVAQGSGESVDVSGMRIDKVVEMVRGKKGTEVRLTVKKVDGSIVVIPIIRDVVILDDTYAKSAVIKKDIKVGYIKLPSFYADFNRVGGRNSGEDVEKEIEKLKNENVQGIVIDLRDNGGGSLQDVVEMAGLFIEKGPIVQVKSRIESSSVLEDKNASVKYDGPLVILVNTFSASASEILAAAMQDYKRAVIIGGNSTFGKGTVQRFVKLDDMLGGAYKDLRPLGEIKITTQKFYRINGSSTQLKGVTPDIILPDPYSKLKYGEKEQDYPMPWDVIPSANYTPWKKTVNVDKIRKNSARRVDKSPSFALINEQAERLKRQSDKSVYTLNLNEFKLEQAKTKEESKKYENVEKEIEGMEVLSIVSEDSSAPVDSVKAATTANWFKKIKKDVYLDEAISVIKDMQ